MFITLTEVHGGMNIRLDQFVLSHHNDVIKWKHFPSYWSFVPGIHQSLVNSLHKGQWRAALMFSLICAWINSWVNNREAGDFRCHHIHYDITVMNWLRWRMSPAWYQALTYTTPIWTYCQRGPQEKKFHWKNAFEKCHCKYQPFCSDLNVRN